MPVKAIEMVRKIRDRHYEETRGLSLEAQIQYVNEKSKKISEELHNPRTFDSG